MMPDSSVQQLSLYQSPTCPFCVFTQQAIKKLNLEIVLKNIYDNPAYRDELIEHTGRSQVPCLRIQSADGEDKWMLESSIIINYLTKFKANLSSTE